MRVSEAANKPWKRAAMKTIPKLCLSVFFFLFHFPSLSSDGSSVAAAPALGATRRRLTGISVKKHGGRLRNVAISLENEFGGR